MAPIQIETVRTEELTMEFFRFGQGKEPLVILPGLSVRSVLLYADAVAAAYRLLTDAYTIYVFDRRKDLPSACSIEDMARDTAAALRALGLRQTALFGASQGGMIAMTIAVRHPEIVKKLILCSTSACMAEAQYRTLDQWVQLAKAGSAAALCLAFGEAIYPQQMFAQLRPLLTETANAVTDEELRRFVILAKGTQGFDLCGDLDKIACPVLLVGSRDDRVLGFGATEQIVERLQGRPDFELHVYDGFGHAAYDIAPDFKARMLRFLAAEEQENLT